MNFLSLTPCQFENMTFDLLQAAGLRNLVWRTPGADGGRDLEGNFNSIDFSAYHRVENWYIECKRYSSSIDWPTVWHKIAYAESRCADFLLIVTNSNPSPSCETEISRWNSERKSVAVRIWRGYELQGILKSYPYVAAKYGLLGNSTDAELSLQTLMFEAMKFAQSAYVSHDLGVFNLSALETSAALNELISSRFEEIRMFGRISVKSSGVPPSYEWLSWLGSSTGWDEVGLRALLAMARYLTGAASISAESKGKNLSIFVESPRFSISDSAEKTLLHLATWVDVEVKELGDSVIRIERRDVSTE